MKPHKVRATCKMRHLYFKLYKGAKYFFFFGILVIRFCVFDVMVILCILSDLYWSYASPGTPKGIWLLIKNIRNFNISMKICCFLAFILKLSCSECFYGLYCVVKCYRISSIKTRTVIRNPC